MFGLSDLKQTRVYQEALEEGALSVVTRQLKRRLGELPQDIEQQVRVLSKRQLEILGEDLLDFTTTTDLEEWLQNLQE